LSLSNKKSKKDSRVLLLLNSSFLEPLAVHSKKRLVSFTIIFVIILNFLFRIPRDPARQGIRDPRLTQESIDAIRVRFGLDKPVINCIQTFNPFHFGDCNVNPFDTQFFIYVKNLVTGEMGISFYYNRPVSNVLGERLWNTIILIGGGQILAIITGMVFGIFAAWKARTSIDYAALITGLAAWSLPTFWLGILLLFWGSNHGFPLGGKSTPGISSYPFFTQLGDIAWHLLLPTITYTIVYMGEYMLIMLSLLDVLAEITFDSKAKG
jgi:peptide/nickel transport system permease protein